MHVTRILLLFLMIGLSSCRYGKIMSEVDPETETAVDTLEGPHERTTKGAELGEFEVQRQEENLINLSKFERVEHDLFYAGNDNPEHTLDIVYPNGGEAPYKPLLLIYSNEAGERSTAITSAFKAAENGYAVVPVKIRNPGEAKWPVALYDARSAIRYLRAHAEEMDLNTEKIVVLGAAETAHLAQFLAATNNNRKFEDPSMPNSGFSGAVQGVISWNGISGSESGFEAKDNPVDLVNADFPPILLLHQIGDQHKSYEQYRALQQRVNEMTQKKTARLISYNSEEKDPVSNRALQEILDFLDEVLYDGNNPFRDKNQ